MSEDTLCYHLVENGSLWIEWIELLSNKPLVTLNRQKMKDVLYSASQKRNP